MPEGKFVSFYLYPYTFLSEQAQAKYPGYKSWKLKSVSDDTFSGSLGLSPIGLDAFLILPSGRIASVKSASLGADNYYVSYYEDEQKGYSESDFKCEVHKPKKGIPEKSSYAPLNNNRLRKPGESMLEYPVVFLHSSAFALASGAVYNPTTGYSNANYHYVTVENLRKINTIFNRDLGINLPLLQTFTYSPKADGLGPYNGDALAMRFHLKELMFATLNYFPQYKRTDYDLAMALGTGASGSGSTIGGAATPSSVCTDLKEGSATSSGYPVNGDRYYKNMAHEFAHQFSANHTYSMCTDKDTIFVEPGGGSTLMGYGACGLNALFYDSIGHDLMFHSTTIKEIQTFTHSGIGAGCATESLNNNNPSLTTLTSYTIPARTPFLLNSKVASDADGNSLTYSWEQIDKGVNVALNVDKGSGALIRAQLPLSTPTRSIPSLFNLLTKPTNTQETTFFGEYLPVRNRILTFRLFVRDGKGGTADREASLKVVDTGRPFKVTNPSMNQKDLRGWSNKKINITWDHANTYEDKFNCKKVNISITQNNGASFYQLAGGESIDNKLGSALVTMPNITSVKSHIRIRCSNLSNIFYAISGVTPLVAKSE